MLLTKEFQIVPNNSTDFKFLNKIGFKYEKGKALNIPIEKLSFGSHRKVTVRCSNCGNIKQIKYQSYNKTTNNGKQNYFCNKKDCINKRNIKNNKLIRIYDSENLKFIFKIK